MFMKRIFLIAGIIFATNANADIMFQLSSSFHSREASNGVNESVQEHHLFIGTPVAVKEQLYLGINVSYTKAEGGEYLNTTEYGPRINYYMNSDKTFFIMLAYNFLSADRNLASGNSTNGDNKLSGTAYLAGLGYEFKVNSNLYIGTSLIYHSTTLDNEKDLTGNKELKYSSINPAINFCFRFR
jgi:hypothetical protein